MDQLKTENLVVRNLTLEDIGEIVSRVRDAGFESGWKNFLQFDSAHVAENIAKMILEDDWLVVGDEEVGCLLIANIKSPWFTPSLHAQEQFFYVRPELRCQGRIRPLITRYVAWAKGRGAKRIGIGVNLGINNEVGTYLCERLGFEKSGDNFSLIAEQ